MQFDVENEIVESVEFLLTSRVLIIVRKDHRCLCDLIADTKVVHLIVKNAFWVIKS